MAHAKGQIRVSFVCFNAYKLFNRRSSAQIGGTEVQMHTLATSLAKDDRFTVSCIVGNFNQPRVEKFGNITVVSAFKLRKSIWNLLTAPVFLFQALRISRPDVIISSPAGPEVGLLALYCIFFPKTTYIFRTASDVDCNTVKEKTFDPVSALLYRFGIRYAQAVVVQHERQQSDLQNYYHKKSRILGNGYSVPGTIIPIQEREKRIAWVGSSRTVKRADIFFKVVEQLPSYSFDMVLSESGDTRLHKKYTAQATRYSNLVFHGELLPDQVNTLLSSARILIGTSDYEGSPNTYIIAALSGTPVISLNVACDGVCVNGDLDQMKMEIKNIMGDDEYAIKISDQALQAARTHYDINKVIVQWISVIQEMYYSQKN
ncbi:MAG: glycosyltransferase family 4 protein [Candidatus Andersenbacteria bacterium]|nr:glycosyltransferase family 4 protein [Candidatus Andersenbacteria bacterium]